MSFTWSVTPSRAWGGLATAYVQAFRNGVRQLADRYADEIETHMKQEARWVDRTGNARKMLTAEVEDVAMSMVEIILAHGVSYGVFLELANAGRYAIIAPTIDIFGPRIWADVRAMLR